MGELSLEIELFKSNDHALTPINPTSPYHPADKISVTKKGDELCIKPLSPYKHPSDPKKNPFVLQIPIDEHLKPSSSHKRMSTTIINEISQTYNFVSASQKTQETYNEERPAKAKTMELSDRSLDSSEKNSDDKSLNLNQPDPSITFSDIFSETSNNRSFGSEGAETLRKKHALLESAFVFCEKCGHNTYTEVLESLYTGTFWEKLFCNFCYSDSSLREFTHVCCHCTNVVFKIKLKIE